MLHKNIEAAVEPPKTTVTLDVTPKPLRKEKPRVLFGAFGWPTGMIEVASWAKQEGVAEPAIYRMQHGAVMAFDLGCERLLKEGRVDPRLINVFGKNRRQLSEDATLAKVDEETWRLEDGRAGKAYLIIKQEPAFGVYDLDLMHIRGVEDALRKKIKEKQLDETTYFDEKGELREGVLCALACVGGGFIKKLLESDPHVVGYRVEKEYDINVIRSLVGVTRMFSDAWVVLGGPDATILTKEVLEESGADFAFAGEAERPFNQFLKTLGPRDSKSELTSVDYRSFLKIPGLAFNYAGRVYHNTLPADRYGRTVLDDLERRFTPEERRYLAQMRRPYTPSWILNANRLDWSLLENFDQPEDTLFIEGGRGCTGFCVFCTRLHGRMPRVKSSKKLMGDMEGLDAQVKEGRIRLNLWNSFREVDDETLKNKKVGLIGLADEDFFLNRRRALEFFRLWDASPLKDRYRLSAQTNPHTLIKDGVVDEELMHYIDKFKVRLHLGVETFNPQLLGRMRKPSNIEEVEKVLDRMDETKQDYVIFQLLTDYDTTPEEFVDTLKLMILNGLRRPKMKVEVNKHIYLYSGTETTKSLEAQRRMEPDAVRDFRQHGRDRLELMDPLVVKLADAVGRELDEIGEYSLPPNLKEELYVQVFEVVMHKLRREKERLDRDGKATEREREQIRRIQYQAERALEEINEVHKAQPETPDHQPRRSG